GGDRRRGIEPVGSISVRRPRRSRPSPGTWSRRVLASLSEHQVQGREVASLEMLLTSIIQLDPPREAFSDLLAQYVDGSRPEIAEAAHLLRRAWLRDHPDTVDPRVPLPELLRTLGGLLDESRVEIACLTVNSDSAHL